MKICGLFQSENKSHVCSATFYTPRKSSHEFIADGVCSVQSYPHEERAAISEEQNEKSMTPKRAIQMDPINQRTHEVEDLPDGRCASILRARREKNIG
ncbi:unnamed protein product [Amoebophrya sp. A25]|nr:unnamed protein product [Amoebophrya sp. A25]|eukprot:GSA25T00000354001.1